MDNEDFDLYGDLDEALIEPLQEEVQKKQAEELEKQKNDENFREKTEKIIDELKTSNFQLKKNMSLLLATAKSEIERKDQQIKDLRREMDEVIFRKNKGSQKKTCDKWAQTDKVEFNDNRSNSSRYNESKLHDRHKPKEPADSDRHKRKLSPERKYSDDYRKTSHRDENGSRSKNYEAKSRKLSHENRSRSPEKHEKKSKHELREDDLRKTLLKNKNDDKAGSSSKESTKKADERRDGSSGRDKKDKYKEKDRIKEKHSIKIEKTDEKRDKKKAEQKVVKEKVASPKKIKDKVSELKINVDVAAENTKPSNDSIKQENVAVNSNDIPKPEKILEEMIAGLKSIKEEIEEPKSSEISISIPDKTSSSKSVETQVTTVDKTALEDKNVEIMEVMSSNLNLSVESEINESPVQSEKVTHENVKEEKEILMPDNPIECITKEKIPVKTEEPEPKKQKYVKIFEAKIFPSAKDMKNDGGSKSAQKFHPISRITSKELLPISVTIDKSPILEQEKSPDNIIITEEITAPITEIMQEIKEEAFDIPVVKNEINSAPESLNDSFESTKENSLNNSFEKRKHKKRKITTEVEADGTVVWTVTRKKRKTKEQN